MSWTELGRPMPVPWAALLSSALCFSRGSDSTWPLVAEPILDVSGLASILEMAGVSPMSVVAGLVLGMPCSHIRLLCYLKETQNISAIVRACLHHKIYDRNAPLFAAVLRIKQTNATLPLKMRNLLLPFLLRYIKQAKCFAILDNSSDEWNISQLTLSLE